MLASFGIDIKQKVRYLGVRVGHVTSEEAYAPLIARVLYRAHFMRNLQLTHEERVALYQDWVLPLFMYKGVSSNGLCDCKGVQCV